MTAQGAVRKFPQHLLVRREGKPETGEWYETFKDVSEVADRNGEVLAVYEFKGFQKVEVTVNLLTVPKAKGTK